jgi:hypothetical protein
MRSKYIIREKSCFCGCDKVNHEYLCKVCRKLDVEKKRIEGNPNRVKVLELRAKGWGVTAITNHMNEEGYRTSHGNELTTWVVYSYIQGFNKAPNTPKRDIKHETARLFGAPRKLFEDSPIAERDYGSRGSTIYSSSHFNRGYGARGGMEIL